MVGDLESIVRSQLAVELSEAELDEAGADAGGAVAAPPAPAAEEWTMRQLQLTRGEWENLYHSMEGDPTRVELVLMSEGRSVGALRVACGWLDRTGTNS